MSLVLASASPRRAELLRAAGIDFEAMAALVDEAVRPGEAPAAYVCRLARDKARAVLPIVGDRFVLGADTAVVVEGDILGKPAGRADAKRMLRLLSGRRHEVITGVCLMQASGLCATEADVTVVECAALTEENIDWYAATGEGDDKAGGYAIQGLASRFITRIDGSYTNVVGLPVPLVCAMLKRAESAVRGNALST